MLLLIGMMTLPVLARASAMGWRKPRGARASRSSARPSAHPWAHSLGIPLPKTRAVYPTLGLGVKRITTACTICDRSGHRYGCGPARPLANLPVRAFDRLERVVVLGIQMPHRPALAAVLIARRF